MTVQSRDFLRTVQMPVIGTIMTGMIVIMALMGVIMMFMSGMVMIVIMMRVIVILLWFLSGRLAHERSDGISEAGHLPLNRLEIAAAVVVHRHRARRHRNRDILDAIHTPYDRIDFRCAGSAIHAPEPVPRL
ncbi:hypothetical protein FHX08_005697 [Rhizobium sp. BK529]|nr:hypothetical protein [Rhizobium sp. BK529]